MLFLKLGNETDMMYYKKQVWINNRYRLLVANLI